MYRKRLSLALGIGLCLGLLSACNIPVDTTSPSPKNTAVAPSIPTPATPTQTNTAPGEATATPTAPGENATATALPENPASQTGCVLPLVGMECPFTDTL